MKYWPNLTFSPNTKKGDGKDVSLLLQLTEDLWISAALDSVVSTCRETFVKNIYIPYAPNFSFCNKIYIYINTKLYNSDTFKEYIPSAFLYVHKHLDSDQGWEVQPPSPILGQGHRSCRTVAVNTLLGILHLQGAPSAGSEIIFTYNNQLFWSGILLTQLCNYSKQSEINL